MPDTHHFAGFIDALRAEGVSDAAVQAILARGVSSAVSLGTALLREGHATQAQLLGAQKRWSSQPPPPAVKRLGGYEVERTLGAGGMGEVYLVRDPETGARFAAKRLLGIGSVEDRLRFAREAQVLAGLNHPYVARVHAAELEGDAPFFVLDHYDGGTLRDRLQKGPLPSDEARALLVKLCEAVGAAHAQGVLHRDLKPENVLFDDQGQPRLADFGLGLTLSAHSCRLTQTGEVLGTPAYMPPEQIRDSRNVDVRSDVYGLGGILYACLCARPPVAKQNTFATLNAVLAGAITPPSKHRPVDRELEAVCLRALSTDPGERYASAGALRDALLGQREVPRAPTAALGMVAAAALVSCVALVGVWLNWRAPAPSVEPAPEVSVTPESEVRERAPAALVDPLEAWRRAVRAPDDPQLAQLALRALAEIERDDLAAGGGVSLLQARAWREAWDLAHATRAIGSVDLTMGVPLRAGEPKPLRRVLDLMIDVDEGELPPPVVATLLIRGLDAWIFRYHRMEQHVKAQLVHEATSFTETLRCTDPHTLAAAASAGWVLRTQPPEMLRLSREEYVEVVAARIEWSLQLDDEVLFALPPHLQLEVLDGAQSSHDPRCAGRLRRWLKLERERLPLGSNHMLSNCVNLCSQALALGGGAASPDVYLVRGMIAQARGLPDQTGFERLPQFDQLEAEAALCAGDVDVVDAYLRRVQISQGVAILAAARLALRARELPLAERAPLLAEGREYLKAADPLSVARRTAELHLAWLSGEPPSEAMLQTWREARLRGGFRGQLTALPWIALYDEEHWRFPCEPEGDGSRRALWVPGTLRR